MKTTHATKAALAVMALTTTLLTACAGGAPTGMPSNQAVGKEAQPPVARATSAPADTSAAKAVPAERNVAPTAAPQATQAPAAIAQQPRVTATPGRAIAQEPTAVSAESYVPPTPAPTPADNNFQDYGVNPFIDTSEDHLSTFALDVDTASYAVTRRYIADGSLPPFEAVRVEEFVNAFKQGYALPKDVAFGIYADGAPSPFHQDGSTLLRIGVQGYDVPDAQRKPASLTFIIDVSGSMADGGRLEMVKSALSMLVERLRADDTVGIVVFTSNAWVVLNPTSGNNKRDILNAIYGLSPMNSTNADAGLRLGYGMAAEMYREGANNRVILCSDGVANTGAVDPNTLVDFVRGYAQRGILLTTVGVGMGNYNDVLLEQLADKGNGFYAYVDTQEEAQKLFLERLTGSLQTIAIDAKVQVDFNPEVVARYRLIGYENRAVADVDFRNDAVDAGEIGAGHTATALYAVQLRPNVQGRMATVQLRWQDPDTRQVKEINGNVNTFDMAGRYEDTAPRYQLAATVMQFAEILRRSPWANGASLGTLAGYAKRVATQLPDDADAQEFAQLVSRASQIGR
jgi:Ca-activated chloride channel homolog